MALYTMAMNMQFSTSSFLCCDRLILNHRGYMKQVFDGRRTLKVPGRRNKQNGLSCIFVIQYLYRFVVWLINTITVINLTLKPL